MKKIIAYLLCLLLLSGCLGGQDIRQRALVQLMGIDYEGGHFKLTLQIFSPSGQNEEGGASESQQVIRAEGATLTEALAGASQRVGRTAFLGDSRAIVIGYGAANAQMDTILRFLSDNDEVYPQVVILVTEGKAGDIVDPETDEGQIVISNSLQHITDSAVSRESVCPSSLLSIAKDFYAEGAGTAVLQVSRRDEGVLVLFEPSGVMVFSGTKPAGSLDDAQHRGMLYLRGLGEGSVFDVPDNVFGRTAVEVKKVDTGIKTRIENGKPIFTLTVEAELLLCEVSGGPATAFDTADIERLATAAAASMKADMADSLRAASRYGGDVFGLWRYLRRDQSDYWKRNGEKWHEHLEDIGSDITVDVRIKRRGD